MYFFKMEVIHYICGNATVKINLNNILNSIAHISKDDVECQ